MSSSGSCSSIPAPSPVFGSAPAAPRCSRFSSAVIARWTVSWLGSPLSRATNATPQASCSYPGSYSPTGSVGRGRGGKRVLPKGAAWALEARKVAAGKAPRRASDGDSLRGAVGSQGRNRALAQRSCASRVRGTPIGRHRRDGGRVRPMPPVREVTVLAAGGTIAMAGDGGATPALDAAGLVAAVPALAGVPGLRARTLGGWPGVHVSAADALDIARAAVGRGGRRPRRRDHARHRHARGDRGAVRPAARRRRADRRDRRDPPRLGRRRRRAGEPARRRPRGGRRGDGRARRARRVRRRAARRAAPCASPTRSRRARSPRRAAGRSGAVSEERVEVWSAPAPPPAAAGRPARRPRRDRRRRASAADGALVEAARRRRRRRARRVLLGAGHAPPAFLAACRAAARRVPVVACVRPESGRILRATYGFEGAERDVRAAGLMPAPALSPAAARITLMACLGAGYSRVATAAAFAPEPTR